MEKEELFYSEVLPEKVPEFYIDFDTDRYAAGWNYRCSKCGRLTRSIATYFPCKNQLITTKIVCMCCNAKWRLSIEYKVPEGSMH